MSRSEKDQVFLSEFISVQSVYHHTSVSTPLHTRITPMREAPMIIKLMEHQYMANQTPTVDYLLSIYGIDAHGEYHTFQGAKEMFFKREGNQIIVTMRVSGPLRPHPHFSSFLAVIMLTITQNGFPGGNIVSVQFDEDMSGLKDEAVGYS